MEFTILELSALYLAFYHVGEVLKFSFYKVALESFNKANAIAKFILDNHYCPPNNSNLSLTLNSSTKTSLLQLYGLNNIACLHHQNDKQFQQAYNMHVAIVDKLRILQKECQDHFLMEKMSLIYVCSRINAAMALESMHLYSDARTLYEEIIKDFPDIAHIAILRLGIVEQSMGNYERALSNFKTLIECCQQNNTTNDNNKLNIITSNTSHLNYEKLGWIHLGFLYQENKHYRSARKSYEHLMFNIDNFDLYGLLLLGNFYLLMARIEPSIEKKSANYEKSKRFYVTALKKEPTSLYAANGIAVVCADSGLYVEASRILLFIKQKLTFANKNIDMNLAQALVETNMFRDGMELFEKTIKAFSSLSRNTNVLIMYSRSQFIVAKKEQKFVIMEQCVNTLEKILELNKNNTDNKDRILYNLSLAKQTYSQIISKTKDINKVLSKELHKAIKWLDESCEMFTYLYNNAVNDKNTSKKLYYYPNMAKQRVDYGVSLKLKITPLLQKRLLLEQASGYPLSQT